MSKAEAACSQPLVPSQQAMANKIAQYGIGPRIQCQ